MILSLTWLFQLLSILFGKGTAGGGSSCPSMPPLPGKKGIGFTLRNPGEPGSYVENMPKVIALQVYWNYAWSLDRVDSVQPSNIEFVPMVWGGKNIATLQDNLQTKLLPQIENGHAKRLLGFNEPDSASQSDMTVTQALTAWPELESVGLPLISPSAVQPAGTWMRDFMNAVTADTTNCQRLQWIGVHWYGSANFLDFQARMTEVYNLYKKPLLLTEFAPADWTAATPQDNTLTDAIVLQFMQQALPWLEQTSWIAGYAWFPFRRSSPAGTHSALFEDDGTTLTTLGQFYASVRTDSPNGNNNNVRKSRRRISSVREYDELR